MGQIFGCNCNNCHKEEIKEEESDSDSNGGNEQNVSAISRREIPKNIVDVKFKTDILVNEYFCNPFDIYQELEELGEGAYGSVIKVCLKDNPDTIRAMKIISKDNIVEGQSERLVDEIQILKKLEHPNIMKIFEYFNDSNNIYIVSELCDQGDLLGKMRKLGSMSEVVVKFLMDQILNAISYLHDNRVFHGDIKLENVMLYKTGRKNGRRFTRLNSELNSSAKLQYDIENIYKDKNHNLRSSVRFVEDMANYEIKLIDFGCSKFLQRKKNNKLSGIVGTSIYCSPEVIDDLYDERSDEWACGVLMYILLFGEAPFPGDTEEEIFVKVKTYDIDYSSRKFNKVSENCKDLMKKLLKKNKKYRITAKEALKHPFFTENFNPMTALTQNKDLNILKRLINFKKPVSKFHETIYAFLCNNYINTDEEKILRTIFRYVDKEEKNRITKKDLKSSFNEIGIIVPEETFNNIFKYLDSNQNDIIEYQEFLRATCDKNSLLTKENLKNVFLALSGGEEKEFINKDDIKKFIFHDSNIQEEIFTEYLEQFGMKKDDKINFEQFYDIIKDQKKLNENNNKENNNVNSNEEQNIKINGINKNKKEIPVKMEIIEEEEITNEK